MLTLMSCLAVQHNFYYVLVAVLICGMGSILSMRLLARVRRNKGMRRLNWLFLVSLVAGGTVWTVHFTAMLGYEIPMDRAFDLSLTVTSLALVIGMALIGFALTTRTKLGPLVEIGGVVFGLGIVAMHYCGIAAVQAPAIILWNWPLVALSVAFSACFGAIATNRIARPVTRFCKYGGSLAMALAIVTTHFSAMAAMTVVPVSGVTIPPQAMSDGLMVVSLVAAIAIIMGMAGSAYMIDFHAAREASDNYQHLALHDPLTGLPNRNNLARQLNKTLANAEDTARVAVVVIDLDRFKDVNDVHGHAAGDAVLAAIAHRISRELGNHEFIARVGGDEFVAIKSDIFARNEALKFSQRLRDLILEPVIWDNSKLSVGCSIGIALYPEHGDAGDLLLARADLAMYRAKELGQSKICSYEMSMDEANRSRAALAIDLRRAIADDEFELYYQVQNDTHSRAIVGFEALLRWNHPTKGRVSDRKSVV